MNTFPSKGVISEEMSPETIVTGTSKQGNRKIIPFGGYAMIYTGTENNMNSNSACHFIKIILWYEWIIFHVFEHLFTNVKKE